LPLAFVFSKFRLFSLQPLRFGLPQAEMPLSFPRDKFAKRANSSLTRACRPMLPLFRLVVLPTLSSVLLVLSGCASQSGGGPVAITKVNPVHVHTPEAVRTEDNMIDFEHRRALWGTVEQEDRRERFGNYFTIFWRTETRQPATVRLEYRQGSTGPRVHVREVEVPSPRRSNSTKVEIVGGEYREQGKVTQWKASIIEGGRVVAEYRSFLWSE